MIFTRKVTLYLNSDNVSAENVADLANELGDKGWLIEEATGRFEAKCNCGNPACADTEVSA